MGKYYIISDEKKVRTKVNVENLRAAVIVHLFYEEQLDYYRMYLLNIPNFIDVIIISPKDIILESMSERYIKIKKENRGRDVSALLVAAKEYIFNYQYICFIHDKKEKSLDIKESTDLWIKNLWNNTLQSQAYIYNVLELMEGDRELGMLVPLPPYGRDFGVWLGATWGPNYENTQKLARELELQVDISKECLPLSYSTVFWARTETLKKLFARNWEYEDFPSEPMGDDGEINHAIERILQYVVEDAGFKTKISVSASYASYFIEQLQGELHDLWKQLDETVGISNYKELDNYHIQVERVKKFGNNHSEIYIYGAGKKGKNCFRICKNLSISFKGFIVTNPKKVNEQQSDLPIIGIDEVVFREQTGIIIAAGTEYWSEIEYELKKRRVEYIFF